MKKGVVEKNELAESSNTQMQRDSAFTTQVTVSGEYSSIIGGASGSISASVGYNARQSSSHSEQLRRNHSNNITRKASSRVKKEHKISFKVVSIAGSEDQAVCEIKNPSDDSPAIVKYFQMLRK